jgi:hypothetical protein
MTLGKFIIETARGNNPSAELDEKSTLEAINQVAKDIVPVIQKLREENRRAIEESKSIVLA